MIVAFQDQYFIDGTYFLLDDKGRNVVPILVLYIQEILKQYNLTEDSLIFYGASKGATVAIDVSSNFKGLTLFINAPQINLLKFIKTKTHHYGLIYEYLKCYGKDKYDLKNKLNETVKKNKVYYSYSRLDPNSNCGIIENYEHKNLIKKEYSVTHRAVSSNAWEWQEKEIIKIIN